MSLAIAASSLWVFYIGFVLYAGLLPAIRARRWWVVLPCAPIIIIAGIVDITLAPVFGILVFHEIMPYKWTISGRLRYHYYDTGWKGERARYLGDRVDYISPFHIANKP